MPDSSPLAPNAATPAAPAGPAPKTAPVAPKVGDVATVVSGGPKMTVTKIVGPTASVAWFTTEGEPRFVDLPLVCLATA
jgi:uncharacterized protein YodC (DUF2158 family)